MNWKPILSIFIFVIGLQLLQPHPVALAKNSFCEDKFALLGGINREELLHSFTQFSAIDSKDNKAFIQLGERANAGNSNSLLFVDNENAVLKELNDKVVLDKDLVTQLDNFHKSLVWSAIESDPKLRSLLVAKYSDFKSLRLAFQNNDPKTQQKIADLLINVNKTYADSLAKMAAEKGWSSRARGLTSDLRNWYHSGFGASPDEAGLAARQSRTNLEKGIAIPRSFSNIRDVLQANLSKVDFLRKSLEARFGKVKGFLVDAGGGKKILSAETIDAIKKVVPINNSVEAWALAVKQALDQRFRILLEDNDIALLRNYIANADQLSPGLMQSERVVIDLGASSHGIISADFKGQNARNLEATLLALASTEGQDLALRVRAVRAGELAATQSLDAKKAQFLAAVKHGDPDPKSLTLFSGDDGIYLPDHIFSAADKQNFLKRYLQFGDPDDLRLTFVPDRYEDSQLPIPAQLRSQFVVSAETVEKKLRNSLLAALPREQLNQLLLGIDYYPRAQGKQAVGIYLGTKNGLKISAAIQLWIKKTLEQSGYEVKFISGLDAKGVALTRNNFQQST